MVQATAIPTLPSSAAHRSPSQRMPDSLSLTSAAGMRSSAASSSVVNRGQFDEYEQQAPQAWQGLSGSGVRGERFAGSDILWLLPDQASSPFRAQRFASFGIFLVEIIRLDDAVGAEAAKIPPQFAPGGENPHRFVVADRDRPNRAFGVAALFVAVAQRDLLALVNLRPCPRHVDAVGLAAPVAPRAACGFEHERPQPLRDRVGDLRHQV